MTEFDIVDTVDGPILPADLIPAVHTGLPLTIGELCTCSEAIHSLIFVRNRVADAIYGWCEGEVDREDME